MTGTYRVVTVVPTLVYIRADSIEEAKKVVQTVVEKYEHIAYPVADTGNERAGVAQPKILSIEVARQDDTIPPMGLLDARGFKRPPETDGQPPQGPSVA